LFFTANKRNRLKLAHVVWLSCKYYHVKQKGQLIFDDGARLER
jgi:hypothetical protein